ncbi:prolyl oligopeptidase family serine peptidase [Maribacter litopenaei]|uniref:Prolyl oligopeptidase family serine peptidase n=1 Tax=Maribacter litopenaei TaxID=2976127 RepID=A0ABY5YBT2_9FLAO|nr:prolyl oligopeptidase family serine peptidase [Maribacter litopenaei]UWX56513.1 prolyl oligopeptidase family serine peptidase [Maribacter litopenaei]
MIALIKDFVQKNPGIDSDRIYIGGCSNGGYMSLKLLLNHPDYFAAGYISALAYHNEFVSEDQLNSIKNIPMWFVHSKDDTTTVPEETVIPLYERLVAAGAPNVHLSLYDHVTDLNGIYGGEDYHFPGHWSWIYSHANDADFGYDGKPVLMDNRPITIMEWLAQQHK